MNSAQSDGTYTISGGTLGDATTGASADVGGSTGIGLFNVVGDGGSILLTDYDQAAKGTLQMDLVSGKVSPVDVAGNITLAANCSLVISGTPPMDVVLMTYTGSLTGTFTNVSGLPGGWSVDYGSGNDDEITLVPEPATLSLLALGGIGVLLRRRRK